LHKKFFLNKSILYIFNNKNIHNNKINKPQVMGGMDLRTIFNAISFNKSFVSTTNANNNNKHDFISYREYVAATSFKRFFFFF
jgi:hypothetical protein